MTDRTRPAPSIGDLIAARYSRRDALRGSASAAAMTLVGGSLLAACGKKDSGTGNPGPTVTATASPTSITPGGLVRITATATDNGSVASSTFLQVSGPAVTLSATTGLTTSFVAPASGGATTIVIRFTATDNEGTSNSTDVNVALAGNALSFTAVAKNRLDVVTVPTGYSVAVLQRTGDPLTATAPAYLNNGTDTDFASRTGDQGAGFVYFGLQATGTGIDVASNTRGLLATAHEGITQAYLHAGGPTATNGVRPAGEVTKEMEAHGLSVVEITRANATAAFATVPASTLNRRVTPLTPVTLNGPVRGNALVQTAFSTAGTDTRGTIGNSALEATPWGTAISGEEKWARYFRRPATDNSLRSTKEIASLNRYGITASEGLYGWATVSTSNNAYTRWDARAIASVATADYRNEPNQFGWVTEIDPYTSTATVRKRTALGRFAHAGVAPSVAVVGVKPAIYMGDNAQNEYLYKFVSNTVWASADAAATDRMAIGDKYLDTGTLYVAKFAADGTGTWLPLTFGTAPLTAANAPYAFTDQADVLTNARLAGDALAATPMDRPDWTAVRALTGEIFVSLNGNDARTSTTLSAPNPRAYQDAPSTATGNRNGHILRLAETASTESTTFVWDIYVLGAGADLDATNVNASALDATNDFSGPESLRFANPASPSGQSLPILWVQTDDTAYRDVTNAMMLAGLPGSTGNGGDKTLTSGGVAQVTKLGAAPGAGLKRFLVGPNEAAIAGFDSTPDGRTVFVTIQHPGESGTVASPTSNWPASQAGGGTGTRPRSATIAITRTDGGVVGL